MVEIIDDSDRLRHESYQHINELLYPKFFLRTAGTSTDIYSGKCPTFNKRLVGQWEDIKGQQVGELFLFWDNVKIIIKGNPTTFYDIAIDLEKHGYRVTIEV